ncbi:MAG: hypothetical protein IH946_00900 [Bacteroidetes bacterium]|nr:hypothetical protein [Bacteroidota bacterium]
MTTALIILIIQAAMGAFDTLYYHEYMLGLPWKKQAAKELQLHAFRDFIYAIMLITLAWFEVYGIFSFILAGLILAEILITLLDFIEEDRIRNLPAGERIMHTLMTFVYAIFLSVFAPVIWNWFAQPSDITPVNYGWISILLSLFSAGVLFSGIRDLAASFGITIFSPYKTDLL